jgi:predicted metal-dependent hydrolase
VDSHYQRGVDLIRRGEYFAAHEELETAWRAAAPEERDFFQGLVHVAVAWYQAGRGNRVGCERQLAKAQRRLAGYTPAHRGLDVARLLGQLATLDRRSVEALDLPEPDLGEYPVQEHAQPPVAVEEEQEPERKQRDA